MAASISIIEPRSKNEFEAYFHLRWQILRKPWKQAPGSERDIWDGPQVARVWHFMLVHAEEQAAIGAFEPIAVARLQSSDSKVAQARYMAVAQDYQGFGYGFMLMQKILECARQTGHTEIWLQARKNAVSFYERCGFVVQEKSYLLYDCIQHFRMHRCT